MASPVAVSPPEETFESSKDELGEGLVASLSGVVPSVVPPVGELSLEVELDDEPPEVVPLLEVDVLLVVPLVVGVVVVGLGEVDVFVVDGWVLGCVVVSLPMGNGEPPSEVVPHATTTKANGVNTPRRAIDKNLLEARFEATSDVQGD